MPSGRRSTRRRPEALAPARRRRASPRVLLVGGAFVVAVVLGAGLGASLAGGSGSSLGKIPARGSPTSRLALPDAASVQRMFAGIPQHGDTLGAATAPATMVEYVDLQCPYCDEFELRVLPTLLAQYVRTGRLRIVARALNVIGPDSASGRDAAIAAAAQDRMFQFMQLLYENQGAENTGWLDDKMVTRAAASVSGLDVRRLLSERDTAGVKRTATGYDSAADAGRVDGTPTILVGRTGGPLREVTLRSPADEASPAAAIESISRR